MFIRAAGRDRGKFHAGGISTGTRNGSLWTHPPACRWQTGRHDTDVATGLKNIHRRTTVYYDLLRTYRERLDACARDPELEEVLRSCQVAFESTYGRWKDSMTHIEQSLRRLALAAVDLQDEARYQAYAQLCELELRRGKSSCGDLDR